MMRRSMKRPQVPASEPRIIGGHSRNREVSSTEEGLVRTFEVEIEVFITLHCPLLH